MIRSWRKARQRKLSIPEVSLTPLIDVALTLLVIFMITAPMMKKENAIQVTLPQGNVKEAKTDTQVVVVSIDAKGKYFLNGTAVAQKNMVEAVKKSIARNADKTVYVKADKGVVYDSVISLVDTLKFVGGVKYVALATNAPS